MAFIISDYLANLLLDAINTSGCVVDIYGSPVSQSAANALIPADANAAIGSATLLCTVSNAGAGTGITMSSTAVARVLSKNTSESWYGNNVASGYASFYRLRALTDTGLADTTASLLRMQGSVGILGTDLVIANAYLTLGQQQRIDSFVVGMP